MTRGNGGAIAGMPANLARGADYSHCSKGLGPRAA